ncbi:ubiquinone biosynthesis accessory factor UbiJ [Endothiovibrio diazotrophicus]
MTTPLHAAIEIAFNRYLAMDPDAGRRLDGMAGRCVAIELSGLELTLYLLFASGGVRVLDRLDSEADTVLRGSPVDLIRLSREGVAGAGAVEIRGDVDLARRFETMLGEVEVDWEEQLSKVAGDVVAHQAARVVRGFLDWGRGASKSLERNVSEYLREESGISPRRDELDDFVRSVDETRNDVERLEARIERLLDSSAAENSSSSCSD